MIKVDSRELEDFNAHFMRKSYHFVDDSVKKGTAAAQAWARKNVAHPGKMHKPIHRKRHVMHVPSGPVIASYVENAAFWNVIDFFK